MQNEPFVRPHARASKRTIAVDFDGVIHQYSKGFMDGSIYDLPVEGARDAMKSMVDKGYRVVIFTTRLNPDFDRTGIETHAMRDSIKTWLKKYGFLVQVHYHELTNNKPPAIAYIDDKGIRFDNWLHVLQTVKEIGGQDKHFQT